MMDAYIAFKAKGGVRVMAEPVEVRIRPHHYDGDVLVGHVEFPEG
jgi:hypothetical protein